MIPFIDLKSQYNAYKDEIDEAIQRVLNSAQFIMGKEVDILEEQLAEFIGSKHAITCSSGNDALLLSLMAIDLQPDDEVIVPAFTFFSTAEVVSFLKAKPVFVDVDELSFNIDYTKIEEKITSKTKAIIPVALYGQPADMNEINAIAKRHNLAVIEDAAQSFGAEYFGKKSGNLSDIGCTSFFPSKPLGCYGDGGAIFTNDENLAKKMKSLRIHGQTKRYTHEYIGMNGRMDAIQAAILQVKLKYFSDEIEKRQTIAKYYNDSFKELAPILKENRTSVHAQYTIRVKDRVSFMYQLKKLNIPTIIHYPVPLHKQPVYSDFENQEYPISEAFAEQVVSLPISPFLTKVDQKKIIEHVLELVRN